MMQLMQTTGRMNCLKLNLAGRLQMNRAYLMEHFASHANHKKQVESIMYCIECEEFLCRECVVFHRGVKLTKTHCLVSKEMSDANEVQINKKEECPVHLNEYIEWFCTSDEKLCCQICNFTEHRYCHSVVAIEHAVDIGKIQAVLKQITENQSQLKEAVDFKRMNIEILEEDRNDSLRVLESIANDTETTFRRIRILPKTENRKIESKYSKHKEHINTEIENCLKIISNLGSTVAVLQKENVCAEYTFLQMKRAEKQLKSVQRAMSNSAPGPLYTPIGYERDKLFDQKLNAIRLYRFGYFDEEKHLYRVLQPEKIRITQKYEKETAVFAMCAIDCDTILITDCTNRSVKLVDINKGAVRSKLELPGSPFGICKLEQTETYAVTVTKIQKVIFIKMLGKDCVKDDERDSFQTGEYCRGIACGNSSLLIACGGDRNEGPGHIRIFDLKGNPLETVIADVYGCVIFSVPYNIELLPGGKTAYITDKKSLIQIDLPSKALKKVTDMLISPCYASICFDTNDRVLIAEPSSKSIKLFSSYSKREESIVSDLPTEPLSIAIDKSALKLYVGLNKSTDLLRFQMEKISWAKPPEF